MSSNKTYSFGAGVLIGTPSGTTPTPVQFGTLQEVSVDFNATAKQLFGQNQFPVAVGRGQAKVSGKAKFANLNGDILNSLFFSSTTTTTGQTKTAYNEAGSIPATPGPYTIAVSNSATWTDDLGVVNVSSGEQLTRVAAAPATGQYSVSAGTYTFASADQGVAVLISYRYTTSTAGKKIVVANPLMGVAPTFQIDLYNSNPNVTGAQWSLRLLAAMSTKLTIATKLDDFTVPEFEFEAFANSSGNVCEFNTAV